MRKHTLRPLLSACFGNLFEHYDTALFGFLSPFLAPLIFPNKDPVVALIFTYLIIPLGMLARPLGSLVFGYIGDVYGRERALFLTLSGMAIVSGGIALSPTYRGAGLVAPILFLLGRASQNFFAAGETMGGAIFLLENLPEKRRDLFSSLFSASTMGGHLLASLGVFLISAHHFIDPGWRFLYLFGCISAVFGCLIRRVPQSYMAPRRVTFTQSLSNLKNALWTQHRSLICIMIVSGFASATYSIALVLMNGFIPLVTTFSKAEVMKINTYLLILDFAALPFFGWIASKMAREKLMLAVALGGVLMALPLAVSLKGAALGAVIGVRMVFVLIGVAFFAPFHAWAQELVPPTCRYAVISLGYALGTQALGSPTAALALWCFHRSGMVSSIVWYWMFLGLLASAVIAFAWRVKKAHIPEKI